MYCDHLQLWLDYGHGVLILLILAEFCLSEQAKFVVSRHFQKNTWEEWPEILHADVSGQHSDN